MIKSLTSLRGIFILFIFFHHCLNIYYSGGAMVVTFFFILGGFCMTLGYKDKVQKPDFSYKQYITRRCIKFYPLHWLCLIASLPLVDLPFTLKQGGVFVINAALIHTLLPVKQLFFSYNAVSWYLADTLFFAIVFPPLIKWILRATPKGKCVIASLFIAVYTIVSLLVPSEWYYQVLYISPYLRLTDFVFGIYLALGYLWLKKQHKEPTFNNNGTISLLVICGFIALLVVESILLPNPVLFIAPVYWVLVAAVILVASSASINGGGRLLSNKYLQRLGELSFTIFMTHQLVLRYVMKAYNAMEINQPIVYIIVTPILTILFSDLIEIYILTHVTQWLTKRNQPSMTARS